MNPSGALKYASLYGQKPDPALNLPWRFYPYIITPGQVGWLPELRIQRKQMRGLFLRRSEINPVTGTYDFLSANPKAGDIVRIEPRIYNYSAAKTASNISVVFQVIPFDSGSNSEICPDAVYSGDGAICPAEDRITIGTTTVGKLDPLQFTCLDGTDKMPANVTGCADPVFIDWDTTNFGPGSIGTNAYRVYVVLNPNGAAGSETYVAERPPVSITHVSSTSPMIVTAPGNQFENGEYVMTGGVKGCSKRNRVICGSACDAWPTALVPVERERIVSLSGNIVR